MPTSGKKPAVKICGITSDTAADAVRELDCDYAGLVFFAASPRHLDLEQADALRARLGPKPRIVAVTVDPDDALIDTLKRHVKPDFFQLHGKETPGRVKAIRELSDTKVIKAIAVRHAQDIRGAEAYFEAADMLIFDAKPPENARLPGGNAVAFDWNLLSGRKFPLPWMLSGGLHPGNVAEAIRITGATAVDVSSGVEKSPGIKDSARIRAFVEAARGAYL